MARSDSKVAAESSWLAVLRGLPQNPLALLLLRARARREARLPRWQRYWLLWAGALAILAAGLLAIAGRAIPLPDETGNLLLIAVLVCWLAEWFYSCSHDALSLLAAGKDHSSFSLDDMLAISQLSDREVVAGFLRTMLPGLLLRLGITLLVAWIWLLGAVELGSSSYLYYAAHGQGEFGLSDDLQDSPIALLHEVSPHWRTAVREVLRLAELSGSELLLCLAGRLLPGWLLVGCATLLSLLLPAFNAVLALLNLLLMQISLGRGLQGSLSRQGLSLLLLSALGLYGWLSWRSLQNLAYTMQLSGASGDLGIWLACLLMVLSSLVLALSLARASTGLRAGFWVIMLGWAAASIVAGQYLSGSPGTVGGAVSQQVGSACLWAWGMLAPFNPLAIPAQLVWMQQQYAPPPDLGGLLQWPLLLGAQLALLWFCLGQACDAVGLRRGRPE